MHLKKNIKALMAATAISAALSSPALAATGTVCADTLYIRSAPSTTSSVVGLLHRGDRVTITYEPSSEWYEIYVNNKCYYVSSAYVAKGTSSTGTSTSTSTSSSSNSSSSSSTNTTGTTTSNSNTSTDTYLGTFKLTAYCSCSKCCGSHANGITASGTVATAGRTVAMGGVPFGTKLRINGKVYTVEDRGTPYGMVDIFFKTHAEARAFGLQKAEVYKVNQ